MKLTGESRVPSPFFQDDTWVQWTPAQHHDIRDQPLILGQYLSMWLPLVPSSSAMVTCCHPLKYNLPGWSWGITTLHSYHQLQGTL